MFKVISTIDIELVTKKKDQFIIQDDGALYFDKTDLERLTLAEVGDLYLGKFDTSGWDGAFYYGPIENFSPIRNSKCINTNDNYIYYVTGSIDLGFEWTKTDIEFVKNSYLYVDKFTADDENFQNNVMLYYNEYNGIDVIQLGADPSIIEDIETAITTIETALDTKLDKLSGSVSDTPLIVGISKDGKSLVRGSINIENVEDKTNKGAANGYAGLDVNQKLLFANIPDFILGQMVYGGTLAYGITIDIATVSLSTNAKTKLNVSTDILNLNNTASGDGGWIKNEGIYYIVNAINEAKQPFAGLALEIGDWVVSTGSGWKKIDNTDAITGVKGDKETEYRTGNINLTPANIGALADTWMPTLQEVTTSGATTNKNISIIKSMYDYLLSISDKSINAVHAGNGDSFSLSSSGLSMNKDTQQININLEAGTVTGSPGMKTAFNTWLGTLTSVPSLDTVLGIGSTSTKTIMITNSAGTIENTISSDDGFYANSPTGSIKMTAEDIIASDMSGNSLTTLDYYGLEVREILGDGNDNEVNINSTEISIGNTQLPTMNKLTTTGLSLLGAGHSFNISVGSGLPVVSGSSAMKTSFQTWLDLEVTRVE